ncbi:hypothetical protein BXZ70DRAFT_910010 [Cristinia sonorae]|uniref:Uncharacterized protein n=1 Tax=Cristinia sonorae TaxID=1940300 RepID=A0A8K0XLI5_9AGAR|nr:hypothetical protein BXZ70DRAFT_910010 [Cristinia sonorae]
MSSFSATWNTVKGLQWLIPEVQDVMDVSGFCDGCQMVAEPLPRVDTMKSDSRLQNDYLLYRDHRRSSVSLKGVRFWVDSSQLSRQPQYIYVFGTGCFRSKHFKWEKVNWNQRSATFAREFTMASSGRLQGSSGDGIQIPRMDRANAEAGITVEDTKHRDGPFLLITGMDIIEARRLDLNPDSLSRCTSPQNWVVKSWAYGPTIIPR